MLIIVDDTEEDAPDHPVANYGEVHSDLYKKFVVQI